MFYCEYCVHGVDMPYTSNNGDAYGFFAFNKQQDRDRFVKENEYYNNSIKACQEITSEKLHQLVGRRFRLESGDDVQEPEYYVVFDRDRLNPLSAKCILKQLIYSLAISQAIFFINFP